MITELERGKLTRRQFSVFSYPGRWLVGSPGRARSSTGAGRLPGCQCEPYHREGSRPSPHVQVLSGVLWQPLRQWSATTHIVGVGKSLFGIEQGDNQPASVNHFDLGIENFNADAIRARLTELDLKFSGTSQESFKFNDPDGF